MRGQFDSAVPAGEDPREYARVLARVHDAVWSGGTPPARPREVIRASWQRTGGQLGRPDALVRTAALSAGELERRRSCSPLAPVLPVLRDALSAVATEAQHIMVVADSDGRVLWREGSPAARRRADHLGFVEGAGWGEDIVGTNAIGIALVARSAVQVFSAEHYLRTHHGWTCAAAPIRDPAAGGLLGVVDLSGPAPAVHPMALALVEAVARLAEENLRTAHRAEVERLRAVALPVLARIAGPALAVDRHGWVAGATGVAPVDRIPLPRGITSARAWLPAYGSCALEPLPGGWLIRPDRPGAVDPDGAKATEVRLDLRQSRQPRIAVRGASGSWEQNLSPRHAEILLVLATCRPGRTASELAQDLFDDRGRAVTVRAEMSRLRRQLGATLDHQPYRFADHVEVRIDPPADAGSLLAWSVAPAIKALRAVPADGALRSRALAAQAGSRQRG